MLSFHRRTVWHLGHSLRGGSLRGTPLIVRSHMAAPKDPKHDPSAAAPTTMTALAASGVSTAASSPIFSSGGFKPFCPPLFFRLFFWCLGASDRGKFL